MEKNVNFEIAKLLKEKGFDVPTKAWYGKYHSEYGSGEWVSIEFDDHNRFNSSYEFICKAPTLDVVMWWLREKHNKHCQIGYDILLKWFYDIIDLKETVQFDYEEMKCHHNAHSFNSYEDAAEDAIKYCLEKLI